VVVFLTDSRPPIDGPATEVLLNLAILDSNADYCFKDRFRSPPYPLALSTLSLNDLNLPPLS